MACKESICRKCFHSYVCEKFNENKDDNNEKCHFFNNHYVPTADVVPRAMIAEIFGEIEEGLKYEIDLEDKYGRNAWGEGDVSGFQTHEYTEDKLDTLLIALSLLKKKYSEEQK